MDAVDVVIFLKNGLSHSESVRLVQTFLSNKGGNLQAGVELQLFKNIVHMAFNSEGGDMQVSGYFLVTQALGDQSDDLTLPGGKLDGFRFNFPAGRDSVFYDL